MRFNLTFTLIIIGIGIVCPCLAQPGQTGGRPGGSPVEQITVAAPEDSTIRFVTGDDLYDVQILQPTSLGSLTHQYDPARQQLVDDAHLGFVGSARRPQLVAVGQSKGLALGQSQYRLYQGSFADFRFYDAEQAMTEFDYSQGADQADNMLAARFGRNFAKGVKLSIDYLRINQTARFSQSSVARTDPRARGKHTRLGIGVWYDAPGDRYDGLYYYGSNSNVQEEFGGITNYEVLDSAGIDTEVPVGLRDGLTIHRFRTLAIQNHFHLLQGSDSLRRSGGIDLIHSFNYRTGFMKYGDPNLSDDASYYEGFAIDDRGVRHFIDRKTTANSIDVQLRLRASKSDSMHQHILRVGLEHRYNNLFQEPVRSFVNELFLNARTQMWLGSKLSLTGRGYLALQGQTGDFNISGVLAYSGIADIALSGGLDLYHRSPNVLERRLFIVQTSVWETTLDNLTHSRLHVEADFEGIDLTLHGALHVINDYIYFDENRQPAQVGGTSEILQIVGSKSLRIGKIGIAGTLMIQSAPEVLAVPGLWGKVQLFYRDRWFRNALWVQTGIDLRITDEHQGVNYFPLTGQFYLDNSRPIVSYPAVDVFFDMQVKEAFRLFFKFENVSALLRNEPFLQIVDYPHFESYFRVGLWMKLYD